MSDAPHFCAGCGVERRAYPRYPWHMCNDCCESAVDHSGRKLRFGNESFGGGFLFSIDGVEGVYSCGGVLCLINGRPARVQEARFGGVVAEPWADGAAKSDRVVDLRNFDPDFSALRQVSPARNKSGESGLRGRG